MAGRRVVVLDSGVIGFLLHPHGSPTSWRCYRWMRALQFDGALVVIPEIVDYEVRRELLRARRLGMLADLDELTAALHYEPLSTVAMRLAAQLWAEARQRGRPTADHQRLDADVILVAQARVLAERADAPIVVATTNVRHLSQFVPAETWETVGPE